jgi:hypothetical protein
VTINANFEKMLEFAPKVRDPLRDLEEHQPRVATSS